MQSYYPFNTWTRKMLANHVLWLFCTHLLLLLQLSVPWSSRVRIPLKPWFFFSRLLLSNCLNWKIHCDDHSSLSSTTAVQIWIISSRVRIPLKPADFFQASSFQLLKLENSLRWSFFTFTYHRSSNMNYFIYFTSWKYIIVLYLQVLNHKIYLSQSLSRGS